MVSESFEPKLPFHRADGKVPDDRIALAMARAEFAPDRSSQTVSLSAMRGIQDKEAGEREGRKVYKEFGIEVAKSDVPPAVLTAAEQAVPYYEKRPLPEDAEFRRIDNEWGTQYVVLYDFSRTDDGWICMSLRISADGGIRGFYGATFKD